MIGFDNKRVYRKIINNLTRSNIYTQEAGAEVAMIKKLIEKIKFDVKIQLVRGSDAQSN